MPLKVKQLRTAGLIVIKDNRLLLAYSKNKQAWYLPGGKIDPGETAIQSLIREVQEELGVTLAPGDLETSYHISAPAFGESSNIQMEQQCFIGPALDSFKASGEIGGIRYFSFEEYSAQRPVVPGVITAFEKLSADQRIRSAEKAQG